MSARRRAIGLAALALAVPLPAFALTNRALEAASDGPAGIAVSTSLGSCGVLGDGIACRLAVSFDAVDGAASYSASVTRADGSVIDYGSVPAGGTSLWVPYVGAGTYSVKVTAYGAAEASDRDGRGEVIASGRSRPEDAAAPRDGSRASDATGPSRDASQTEVTGREPQPPSEIDSSSVSSPDPAAVETAPSDPAAQAGCDPTAGSTATPTPPPEPPEDLDPDNPDEDGNGVADDQQQATYEQQLSEYQAALAAQAADQPPAGEGC